MSNGNICSTIQIEDNEIVLEHFLNHSLLIVLSKEQKNSNVVNLRGYNLNIHAEYKWGFTPKIPQFAEFKFKVECGNKLKVIKVQREATDDVELIILNELTGKSAVEVYKIKYSELLAKTREYSETLAPYGVINIDMCYIQDGLLNNPFTVTSLNDLLILLVDTYILFINLEKKRVIKSHKISNKLDSMKYFLSPTNLTAETFTTIEPIPKTNNCIALDNLNNLNYVHYNIVDNSIKIINYDTIEFKSFYVYKNILVAYSKANSKLYGYDVSKLGNKSSLKETLFVVDLNKSFDLTDYGISTDCVHLFVIENKRNLLFYRLKDMKKTAEMSLYCPCINIICNEEFVCLSMEDRKIITYFICKGEETLNKIKNLHSRYFKIFLV